MGYNKPAATTPASFLVLHTISLFFNDDACASPLLSLSRARAGDQRCAATFPHLGGRPPCRSRATTPSPAPTRKRNERRRRGLVVRYVRPSARRERRRRIGRPRWRLELAVVRELVALAAGLAY